jgi:hypothetical protein
MFISCAMLGQDAYCSNTKSGCAKKASKRAQLDAFHGAMQVVQYRSIPLISGEER